MARRLNREMFVGSALLRYSNLVVEMRDPDGDNRGHFNTRVVAGMRTFREMPIASRRCCRGEMANP